MALNKGLCFIFGSNCLLIALWSHSLNTFQVVTLDSVIYSLRKAAAAEIYVVKIINQAVQDEPCLPALTLCNFNYDKMIKLIVNLNNKCIKIWSLAYKPNPAFKRALEVNFFDKIGVDIECYVQHNNEIVGYVSDIYDTNNSLQVDKKRLILPYNLTNDKFINFINQIYKHTVQHNLVYYDLFSDNIVIDNNGDYRLIDLESMLFFDSSFLNKMPKAAPSFYIYELQQLFISSR